jgi:DNA-binding response OmpR family regulator
MTILLVLSSDAQAALFSRTFNHAGFCVDVVQTASAATATCLAKRFELILFDLAVFDADGLSWLKALRAQQDMTPVVLLAAEGVLPSDVTALGICEYLTKPVSPENLVDRARTISRMAAEKGGSELSLGNLLVDTPMHQVIVEDRARNFTVSEVILLEQLMRHRRRIVGRQFLERIVYGARDNIGSNAIEAHMSRLRRRLREVGATVRIQTIRSVGYMIEEAC